MTTTGLCPKDYELAMGEAARRHTPRSAGYPRQPTVAELIDRRDGPRRFGAVLGAENGYVRLWINGITPSDRGVVIPQPPAMPSVVARKGATFDVTGINGLEDMASGKGKYVPQPMSDDPLDRAWLLGNWLGRTLKGVAHEDSPMRVPCPGGDAG